MKKLLLSLTLALLGGNLIAQSSAHFQGIQRSIKFEAQRYLMESIILLDDANYERMRVKILHEDFTEDGSSAFAVTGYMYESDWGLVFSTFSILNAANAADSYSASSDDVFTNVNISHKDVMDIDQAFKEMAARAREASDRWIYNFNNELILEVFDENNVVNYSI